MSDILQALPGPRQPHINRPAILAYEDGCTYADEHTASVALNDWELIVIARAHGWCGAAALQFCHGYYDARKG